MCIVGEAANDHEAVARSIRRIPFECSFAKPHMPEMNGIEATVAIRWQFMSVRIIVLSTYAGDALPQSGCAGLRLKRLDHKRVAPHDSRHI
jgi:DNA-binding NarL/FixJ family response regulator